LFVRDNARLARRSRRSRREGLGHFEGLSKRHNSFLISCLGFDRGVIASAKNTKQLIVAANLNRFIL
jgi:hypothetical protein